MSDTIPHGYKMTEVGVIPEDWSSIKLENAGTWKGGGTPSKSNTDYWNNGTIPWVSSGDVKVHWLSNTLYKITKTAVTESSTNLLDEGAILIVMRSGILRKYLPVAINVVPVAINQDLKAIIPNGIVLGDYLLHMLLHRGDHILSTCMKTGTTVESIEYSWLKRYEIPLPPTLTEQRAIADALSDVDAQITALGEAIAKKRDLKQGAMQRLLTGEERLPGFSGEWEMKLLGGLLSKLEAGVSVNSVDDYTSGINALILKTSAVSDGYFLPQESKLIAMSEIHQAKVNPVSNSIIISRMNTPELVGECGYVDKDYPNIFLPDRLWLAQPNHEVQTNAKWLSYYLVYYQEQLKEIATGTSGSMKNISKTALLSLPIMFPSPAEQTAIAAVLSDIDAEIGTLEAQREKTVALKTGMMQELLTGKTRLI